MTLQFVLVCPQRSLCVLISHSVLVHESFEYCTLLGGAFCIAHRAPLNVEFVTDRIDLRGLRWNVSLMRMIFSSEVRVFAGDFTRNRLSAVLSLLSQNRMLLRIGD
jgi:hypothetical protein